MQNFDQTCADVQTVSTLQRTQMTAILNTNPVLLSVCYLDHFGGKCKGLTIFIFVWNTV